MDIFVPVPAVLGIVAKENGEGMWFPKEEGEPESEGGAGASDDEPPDDPPDGSGPPRLRVVK